MVKKNLGKKLVIGAVVGLAAFGLWSVAGDSDVAKKLDMSGDNGDDSSSHDAYAYSLTSSDANFVIDDEGVKENKAYEIEAGLTALNGTSTNVLFTIPTKLLLTEGKFTKDDLIKKEIFLGFTNDVELENGDEDEIKLIDFKDTLVNGEEGSVVITYDENNDETLLINMTINPDSEDLFNDLDNLEDDDDEYSIMLTQGLATDIKLIFKNDING